MSTQVYQLGGNGSVGVPTSPILAPRDPAATDIVSPNGGAYIVGQLWRNILSTSVFEFLGGGVWAEISQGTGGPITTLTGNSGGAISPVAGNINVVGSGTTNVVGSGNSLTISATAAGYPITPFVVGAVGKAGYQTIQSAITAAVAAGSGSVYVQPGTYTENLTLANGINVIGTIEGNTTIVGVHVPPATGSFYFQNVTLSSATHIFSSAVAGSAALTVELCLINVTNGYLYNLANWTGTLASFNCGSIGTNDGFINNTGGSSVICNSTDLGIGSANACVISGAVNFRDVELRPPVTFQGSAEIDVSSTIFLGTVTTAGSVTTFLATSVFQPNGATSAISHGSTGIMRLGQSIINSSNANSIDGAGAGVLHIEDVAFENNTVIAGTLTLGTTSVLKATNIESLTTVTATTSMTTASFITSSATLGTTFTANAITPTGSDANIDLLVNGKGTGGVIQSRGLVGSDLTVEVTNTDNTNGASRAGFEAAVGGASAGDPYVNFLVSGAGVYTMGIDNSVSDDFVLAASAALGTSNIASWTSAGALTNAGSITSTTGNITATAGNLVAVVAGSGLVLPVGTASGATPQVVDARVGSVTFTGISIAAAADSTLVLTNSTITGASTRVLLSMIGATTGSATSIKSVTPSAGSLSIVVTNGTGATTTTADITFDFVVLN